MKRGKVQGQRVKKFTPSMWARWMKELNARDEPSRLTPGIAELRWRIGLMELANYRLRLPD